MSCVLTVFMCNDSAYFCKVAGESVFEIEVILTLLLLTLFSTFSCHRLHGNDPPLNVKAFNLHFLSVSR